MIYGQEIFIYLLTYFHAVPLRAISAGNRTSRLPPISSIRIRCSVMRLLMVLAVWSAVLIDHHRETISLHLTELFPLMNQRCQLGLNVADWAILFKNVGGQKWAFA